MKEIVVVSGKGGTGKTSLVASIVPHVPNVVIADCDVDAPDLDILLSPEIEFTQPFVGLRKAELDPARCNGCGRCVESCRFGAIAPAVPALSEDRSASTTHRLVRSSAPPAPHPTIRRDRCEGCGVCAFVCPTGAITMEDAVVGEIHTSHTVYGPMVHARMDPGEEASGKLVCAVRERARKRAEAVDAAYLLVDGSPGVGCNVISSVTNADHVVIVTEPTVSGYHDVVRVHELVRRFGIPRSVVINKFDLSSSMSATIELFCAEEHTPVVLKLPFDTRMVEAITARRIPSLALPSLFADAGFADFIAGL